MSQPKSRCLLVSQFINGREIHIGKYYLKNESSHQEAIDAIMGEKGMKNRRYEKSHEDMTGAVLLKIF